MLRLTMLTSMLLWTFIASTVHLGAALAADDDIPLEKDTINDIAICSAGISISKGVQGKLAAGLQLEKKSFSGDLSAEFVKSVKNTIINDSNLSETFKSKFLDLYFPCIKERLAARSKT